MEDKLQKFHPLGVKFQNTHDTKFQWKIKHKTRNVGGGTYSLGITIKLLLNII